MKNLDTPEFLGNRNNILMAFLLSIYPAKDPNSFQLAMVVESIYNLRKSTLVLPHCYMTNLVQKSILGSKSVTALNGKLLAGGSDTTYRNWLKFNAVPIEYPAGDSDIFIDNCGHYIVKSCEQVYYNRKRKCDVCGGKVVNIIDEIAPVSINIRKEFPTHQSVGETLKMNRIDVTMGMQYQ